MAKSRLVSTTAGIIMLCGACAYIPLRSPEIADDATRYSAPDSRVFSYFPFAVSARFTPLERYWIPFSAEIEIADWSMMCSLADRETPVLTGFTEMTNHETETHRGFVISVPSAVNSEIDARAKPLRARAGRAAYEARAEYWQLKRQGKYPLLIVFPVPGAVSWPQDRIRDMVTEWQRSAEDGRMGFHLLIVDTGGKWLFDYGQFAGLQNAAEIPDVLQSQKERVRAIVINARRILDHIIVRDEIDADRIGVIGASVGGMLAALAMGADSRIASGLFMMAGGDFPLIMTESEQEDIRMIRELVYRRFGWSKDEWGNAVRLAFSEIDPMVWAGAISPRPVFMFIAEYDTYIPAASSWGLWRRSGGTQMPLVFSAGHKSSFVGMSILGGYRMEREIYRFFSRTLR